MIIFSKIKKENLAISKLVISETITLLRLNLDTKEIREFITIFKSY